LEKIFVSEEIWLDELREADIPQLAQAANDPDISNNTLGIPYPYSEHDAREFIQMIRAEGDKLGKQLAWGIRLKNKLVGTIGLKYDYGPDAHLSDFGFWLAKDERGKGIMTQAVRAFCRYHLNRGELKRIEAHIFTFNEASKRVLEKAGFRKEGLLRKKYLKNKEYIDVEIYSLIDSDLS
jgi:RimJ/RimL family protein N-acetyltransferase